MNTAQTRWSIGGVVAVLLMILGGCVAAGAAVATDAIDPDKSA